MPDASAVMQLLLKTQTDFNDLEDDDPQVGTLRHPPPLHPNPPAPSVFGLALHPNNHLVSVRPSVCVRYPT